MPEIPQSIQEEHPAVLPHSQAKPLIRMISKMIKPKSAKPKPRGKTHGRTDISADQNVHITQQKVRYW